MPDLLYTVIILRSTLGKSRFCHNEKQYMRKTMSGGGSGE